MRQYGIYGIIVVIRTDLYTYVPKNDILGSSIYTRKYLFFAKNQKNFY